SIKFLACEVTDTGGVDDKGFNQNAHDGLLRAQSELGIQIALLESTADTDYAPNINTFISQGCLLIVTVGFLLGDATNAAATATGSFTGDFTDQNKGRTTAEAELQAGADVIYAVAGPVGQGAMAAVLDAGNAYFIGVDVDQYISVPGFESIMLSSELKRIDNAVFEAITEAIAGPFPSNLYVGTLANDGVGIAPYHDLDSKVPQALKDEITALKAALVDASVTADDFKVAS